MSTVGITALVPPELIFACGHMPLDVNNHVPSSAEHPVSKLCAWTATWREMLLQKRLQVDSLVVVAGGDCHNALADGQRVALGGIPAHFFFYPFDGDTDYMEAQMQRLVLHLGGEVDKAKFREVGLAKELGMRLEQMRIEGRISGADAFRILISFSDLCGDIPAFMEQLVPEKRHEEAKFRVGLIGVPPIYKDFHEVAESFGMHIAYDELPYEFLRLGGNSMAELAKSYAGYTFARSLGYRLDFLERELARRRVDGVIHYTQFACHHLLEDDVLRRRLDYPVLTVQGDMPGSTPEQVKLRLEAFSEMLGRAP
ncbi:MAG TPA: 2-hydroxyacyl-CoA dehydratase [Candidatus Methanoperedenaceae archaeon]|nr:2-hydroxyacyl-CoA dehydratase [Candidatus Methanoperedenaceae archaeon]